jgi:hypothetical protein
MAMDSAGADAAAKAAGLPYLERIRNLRTQFSLSLDDAKAVADATDGRPPPFPPITDCDQLDATLRSELGYCGCASANAVIVLRDLLRAARARSDATDDPAAFSEVSRGLEEFLTAGGGWAEWLVYGLDQRGLVSHGFRQDDLRITDKGRWLLTALDRFGEL